MKAEHEIHGIKLWYRPHTTDEKVIQEVLKKKCYERKSLNFYIQPKERWLDVGANIGTFSLFCLSKGASVIAFEPEPENFDLLSQNLRRNACESVPATCFQEAVTLTRGTKPLYLCKGDYNKYRHSLYPKRGRTTLIVRTRSLPSILKQFTIDCLKIDIEGYEIDLLEGLSFQTHFKHIKKLVFEYSFDVDPSIPRFMKIIQKLKTHFSMVHYEKVKEHELEYRYFPACTLVFCKRDP